LGGRARAGAAACGFGPAAARRELALYLERGCSARENNAKRTAGGGATNARGRRGGQPFKEPIQDIGDEAGEDTVEYQVNDRICHGGCEQCGGVGFFFLLRFSAPCFALEE
jgi:hypothetical protein